MNWFAVGYDLGNPNHFPARLLIRRHSVALVLPKMANSVLFRT
jgi:hypothetical protein